MSEQLKKATHIDVDEKSKLKDLEEFREYPEGQFLTTDQGVRVSETDMSLKAGERGPTLLEDFHFREKLTHFDHERIPERIVHARGTGAHGYFECYESMAEYTMASFLQEAGKKTPVFVRFSTVVGFRGSADTVRDARGFATKFYTEDGNYDLVGNNIPVFFIQDAIKFPDLVHSIKPEPDDEMPQASAAHDTFWDFVASHPENAHMIMWVLSDRGIPRSYRMMQGFGVNTFRFVNKQGKGRFVKFHWIPKLGVHSLVWDEAQKIAGKDPDYHRRDLYEAIEEGHYPEYELGVQIIEEEDEHKFDFDLLDATKIVPEEQVPLKIIGKLTLTSKPDNFFAEVEQVAFCPANVVPGIDFTNDPLLQGRLFSYLDTQLIRLGGPNFHEIPINRPLAPYHNNQRDGYHRMTINKGKSAYFPNTVGNGDPRPASREEHGYVHYTEKVEGKKIRARSDSFKDFFSQATLFWNSMTEPEKEHIVKAFHFEVGKVKSLEIRQRIADMFANVDPELGRMIAEGVSVKVPEAKAPQKKSRLDKSPALSQANKVPDTIESRKVAILAANGVNASHVEQLLKLLKEKGASAKVVSMTQGTLRGSGGGEVMVDKSYETTASVLFDAVFVPGGRESVEALKSQGSAVHFINEAFRHCKPIAATGEGVELLKASSIKGVKLSGEGEKGLVSDRGVVTAAETGDFGQFFEAFRKAIAQHRHWDREKKEMVPA
ncbi:catalase [Methanocella arvoryzae]|uniref:Catalase n=1 Tax=Methanocella arvoryzae (strain DSM 22066 / NBRC 105507 / MRE50) TaxID=351160 RepID=Q0W6G9_METAR|nr:catalase [Methanocella arvoryzae]CAJ36024.1 monofunctional large subunit heme catalase (type I, clade II) [Methanocella arvoryzae MRE50]